MRMLALEEEPRNKVLLRLLYYSGLRVSEIAALSWRDLQPRTEGGQVTVFGKGGKTRAVLLPATIWRELEQFREGSAPEAPRVSRHAAVVATRMSRRSSGLCGKPRSARASTGRCRRTGYDTATRRTRSSAEPPSTWCRQHSDTPALRQQAAICTRGPRTARRSTWWSDCLSLDADARQRGAGDRFDVRRSLLRQRRRRRAEARGLPCLQITDERVGSAQQLPLRTEVQDVDANLRSCHRAVVSHLAHLVRKESVWLCR